MSFSRLQFCFMLVLVSQFVLHSATDSKFISKSYHKRSDDQSSVEILFESLSRQLSETNAKLAASDAKIAASDAMIAASDAKMAALEAKLDKVQQTSVAFYAAFSNDPVTLGPKAPLILNVAPTNIGNGYDIMTGHFTAPVSGTYMFMVNFMGTTTSHLYVSIWVDNTFRAESISDSDGPWDHVSENLVVHLTAGQRVHLINSEDAQKDIRGGQWSTFSGFLIQADP